MDVMFAFGYVMTLRFTRFVMTLRFVMDVMPLATLVS
jgi:hypothetical protein